MRLNWREFMSGICSRRHALARDLDWLCASRADRLFLPQVTGGAGLAIWKAMDVSAS